MPAVQGYGFERNWGTLMRKNRAAYLGVYTVLSVATSGISFDFRSRFCELYRFVFVTVFFPFWPGYDRLVRILDDSVENRFHDL